MTSRHRYWHRNWRRDGARLVHASGLAVEHDDVLGWMTCDDTLDAWAAAMLASGVPVHDHPARLGRLLREAARWRAPSPR